MSATNPVMFMLVGVPGSGKSTFRYGASNVLSSDDFIEQYAMERDTTYNDVFKEVVGQAHKDLDAKLVSFIENKESFIWDQTNLNQKTRVAKLARIPKHYRKTAVFFDVPLEVAKQRNAARSRSIPEHIIESMFKSIEIPTVDEGFDNVFIVDQNGELVK